MKFSTKDMARRVGRARYFGIGVALFAVKHILDRIVATQVFGLSWSLFNYWIIGEETRLDSVPYGHVQFYATLITIAIPFIWIGVVLTIGRLRDIGWPLWLVAVLFLPFDNLLYFLILSVLPSRDSVDLSTRFSGIRGLADKVIPHGGGWQCGVGNRSYRGVNHTTDDLRNIRACKLRLGTVCRAAVFPRSQYCSDIQLPPAPLSRPLHCRFSAIYRIDKRGPHRDRC